MAQPTPARARRCRDCDGFPVVHITTGTRHRDGSRATLRVTCRACHGTGTYRTAAPAAARAGR
ncbi:MULTISPECIES: hypothetical protein [unclassified Streptomyces]|uniref:hypothetical protein n=1 Tax=unclassified Streptomyces TaxID=2593676 RepID=UPI002E1601EA|nr:hypothetical protein OG533_27630 [Streptomyces sp. NBC_01186]WSS44079.1 hypothetical protein OG220_28435 [Streptomyces sp. NBC_01187]